MTLRELLRELTGAVAAYPGALDAPVTVKHADTDVIEVAAIDRDGYPVAIRVEWEPAPPDGQA